MKQRGFVGSGMLLECHIHDCQSALFYGQLPARWWSLTRVGGNYCVTRTRWNVISESVWHASEKSRITSYRQPAWWVIPYGSLPDVIVLWYRHYRHPSESTCHSIIVIIIVIFENKNFARLANISLLLKDEASAWDDHILACITLPNIHRFLIFFQAFQTRQ